MEIDPMLALPDGGEPPKLKCPECGEPLPDEALGTICKACLHQRHLVALRVREVETYTFTPLLTIQLGFDRRGGVGRGPRHILFTGERHLALCGAEPNEALRTRPKVTLAELPKSYVCTECRRVLDEIARRARLRWIAAQGVTP